MHDETPNIFSKSFHELKGRKLRHGNPDDYEEGDKFWLDGVKYEKVDRDVAKDIATGQIYGVKPNDKVRAE